MFDLDLASWNLVFGNGCVATSLKAIYRHDLGTRSVLNRIGPIKANEDHSKVQLKTGPK